MSFDLCLIHVTSVFDLKCISNWIVWITTCLPKSYRSHLVQAQNSSYAVSDCSNCCCLWVLKLQMTKHQHLGHIFYIHDIIKSTNELQLVVEVPLSRTRLTQLEFDRRARRPRVWRAVFSSFRTRSCSDATRIHINTGVHSNRSTFFKTHNGFLLCHSSSGCRTAVTRWTVRSMIWGLCWLGAAQQPLCVAEPPPGYI